jgi:glycosyltransferase involved in cell wall biosynthesis
MSEGSQNDHHVIVAVGGFPPPVTGAAKNLEMICTDIAALNPNLIRCNVARGRLGGRWMMLPRRIWCYTLAWATLARQAGDGQRTLYLTSDGGPGLLFTLLTVLVARHFRYRVILQHRTFQYIRNRSPLAAAVNRRIGENGLHVFLSEEMAQSFFQKYEPRRLFAINHNLAQNLEFWRAVRKVPRRRPGPELVVGYLSNLMFEKGFDTFLDVARLAVIEELPCTFVIAGPTPGSAEEAVLRKALQEPSLRLEYRGAVHHDAKLRFYRDIDIFLFPTRYKYEAQPNVVLEALAAGNYVIATDIGVVSEVLSDLGGQVVPFTQADDAAHWIARLKPLVEDRATLVRKRAILARQARKIIIRSSTEYQKFLRFVLG